MIVELILLEDIMKLLGVRYVTLVEAVTYGRINSLAIPAFILQVEFQSFFIAAERPNLGFLVMAIGGCTNIFFDFVFIIILNFGLEGAALATVMGNYFAAGFSLIYFARKNKSLLRLTKPSFDKEAILKTCVNGASEFINSIAVPLISTIYNIQLLKYVGANGVVAHGILMYVNLIFNSIFFGYSIGVAPIISYNYGARNFAELKNLLRLSVKIIGITSIVMFTFSEILARPISEIFVGHNPELLKMTSEGFKMFSFTYLFEGLAIFCSHFFTALSDGVTSMTVAFLRTLVFEIIAIFVLPIFFGVNGIWLSVVFAELMAFVLSISFLVIHRRKFNYW